jgi:hypothetical protein
VDLGEEVADKGGPRIVIRMSLSTGEKPIQEYRTRNRAWGSMAYRFCESLERAEKRYDLSSADVYLIANAILRAVKLTDPDVVGPEWEEEDED